MNTLSTISLKYLSIFTIFIMVSVVFNGIVMNAFASGYGAYPSPENGDWIITNETYVQYETILLNGNLIITNTGKLTLYDAVLQMNCSYNGEFKIQVNQSGELNVLRSTIQNGSSDSNHNFYYLPDSQGIISNSTISHCGYATNGSKGLRIELPKRSGAIWFYHTC